MKRNPSIVIDNDGWAIATLDAISEGENAIVDGPFGSNLKKCDYVDDSVNGVPVLSTRNLNGDYSDSSVRFISKEKFKEIERSKVKPGDILVAKIGSIGKTGIYPKGYRVAIIPANLLKFSVSKLVEINYIYMYLNCIEFQNKIKKIATATAQPAFNITKFRLLQIPVPPMVEQRAIVSKIEQLFSELDSGVENLKKAQAQLKVYRQAVLKWAFEGKFTRNNLSQDLPEGWKLLKLKDITNEIDGLRRGPFGSSIKKSFFVSEGYKVYEQGNAINDDPYRGTYYINEEKYNELIKFKVIPGDLIVSCSGVTLGRISEIPEDAKPGVINQALLRIRLKSHLINNKFFMSHFRAAFFQKKIFEQSQGTAMPNLVGIKDFKEIELKVPSLEEQNQIVLEIEARLSVCDKLEETIALSLQKAESLRQSILKKAFEGKLLSEKELEDLRNTPDWEPAEKLLDRIKSEKEQEN